jgi:ubiquinone/menaquinone biosynthesis C-methylase UbiE
MFSDPIKNIAQARFTLGSTIADFGSGSGHYARALSSVVGEKGKVLAVDVQKELLSKLKREALANNMLNIEVVWGDLEKGRGSKIKEGLVDGVVISNLLFQVENKDAIAIEASRIVKRGGSVLILDWQDSTSGVGPKKEMLFDAKKAEELFSKHGFLFEREIDAGSHHYGIILKKV